MPGHAYQPPHCAVCGGPHRIVFCNAKPAVLKRGGRRFGAGPPRGTGRYGGPTDPKNMALSMLFEVVVRFWRDFFRLYGPYPDLPAGKTKLSDEQ